MATALDDAQDFPEDSRRTDRSNERDRDKSKSKAVGQSTKGKDLSHVPCKFFRLGQCTAGSSCVFSHNVAEPGQSKEICTWFVKGNCKFGHKCALAHILPGQPMSMDRKNKKAAQQQNQGASGGSGTPKSEKEGRSGRAGPAKAVKDRNPALALTTRLTVPGSVSRLPMVISKATMSPSAPAPLLRDTDFAKQIVETEANASAKQSFEEEVSPSSNVQRNAWHLDTSESIGDELDGDDFPSLVEVKVEKVERRPSPLPLHTPLAHRGFTNLNGSPAIDFGPVGSPPRSSPMASNPISPAGKAARINGLSPGPSPNHGPIFSSNSPFSAPVAHTVFTGLVPDRDIPSANDYLSRPILASSLGANNMLSSRPWDIRDLNGKHSALADDDGIEDFLPSSLNELLTPAERHRRESRSSGLRPTLEPPHHRHSRSVPALTLLDHMKNIWTEDAPPNASPSDPAQSFAPSSFSTGDGLASGAIASSNVSAGFLSALHQSRSGTTARSVSDPHAISPISKSPSKSAAFGARAGFEPASFSFHPQPATLQHEDMVSSQLSQMALSPSSRALQSHAPGTSLPQGLAAGYSRIHARPTSILSALSPPNTAGLDSSYSNNRIHPNENGRTRPRNIPVPMTSPLARPIMTNELDDDEMFEFDMDSEHQN